MSGQQALSDLIGSIYDCAIDQARWTSTLHQVVQYTESSAVKIDIVSTTHNQAPQRTVLHGGMPPGSMTEYFERHGGTNKLISAAMLYDVNEIFTMREALAADEIRTSKVYNEWCVPRGFLDIATGIIRKDAERRVALTLLRTQSFGEPDKVKMRLLLPHFRRCVTIAQLLDNQSVERNRFQDLIDHVATAVFLVDAEGFIQHANAGGEKMLTTGALKRHEGRLMTVDAEQQASLTKAIEAGDASASAVPITAADGTRLVATILPLSAGLRQEASGVSPGAAAVFVHTPAGSLAMPGETLRRLFELTGAETHLLIGMAGGESLEQSAVRLGFSSTTARMHLDRIFAKTETASETDLRRRMSQLVPKDSSDAVKATRELLSERRRAIVRMAAQGLQDKQISLQLSITESTVRNHWQRIFARLEAANRTEAVTKALRMRLI